MTVTLKHLAATLSGSHDLPNKQAEAALGDLVTLTTRHLKNGDKIRQNGRVSSETEQHLKHEFRKLGWDASDPTLAVAIVVEIDRPKREAAIRGTVAAVRADCQANDEKSWRAVTEDAVAHACTYQESRHTTR